ncbi:MAG TPA: long-chain fatty acid--CoA ligase, partial [Bacteroidetes bacterium]|nr:long-chain fatty acid--CoA ligase [Bacteroidota bacterium]
MMEVKRLFDIFPYQLEKYALGDAMGGKVNGVWETYSTQQVIDMTDGLALGMLNLGLRKGDMIAIISGNCVEWALADLAIQKMGGIVVPLYPSSSADDLTYIMNHAEIKLVFCEEDALCEKIKGCQAQVESLNHVYTFREVKGEPLYKELLATVDQEGRGRLKDIQDTISAHDLATIIYTSGTTGRPKGVMLSHNNIVSNVNSSIPRLPVKQGQTGLSFLPLSHIFERMICYMYFFQGIAVRYGAIDQIPENLKAIRPHVFTAVPRLLEKVYDKVIAGGMANKGLKLKIFKWAIDLALRWEPDGKNGAIYNMQLKMADKLVFAKIRDKAGLDRVGALASGSAALQARLARFYNAIGVPLVEGYGLTETSPVISVNGFGKNEMKIGAVGRVVSGGEVKIFPDGEICYKGPNLMMGYYKNEAMTKEVIDENGWFHSGDIGEVDKDGFLKITDRKKEMWKTSGGKYIAPQVIENKFKESPFIEQVVVVGEGQKFAGALIVPNFEVLCGWMEETGISFNRDMPAAIISMDEVKKKIESETTELNKGFGKWEMIKRFELLPAELSVEGGELTPSLKMKRKVIVAKYATEI